MRFSRRYNSFVSFISVLGFISLTYLMVANLIELRELKMLQTSTIINEESKNSKMLSINGQTLPKVEVEMPPFDALPPLPPLPLVVNEGLQKSLQLTFFTLTIDGTLGQILFELLSLIGISDELQRIPVTSSPEVFSSLNSKIRPMFPHLADKFQFLEPMTPGNVSTFFGARECCVHQDTTVLKGFRQPHLTLKGFYFQSFKYFQKLRSIIPQLLAPSKVSTLRAELMIKPANRKDFKICVHTRRPDVKKRENSFRRPSDSIFTRKATDFLVEKYKKLQHENVTVFLMGNDPLWTEELFADKLGANKAFLKPTEDEDQVGKNKYEVFLTPSVNPDDDIAFSSQYCDVVLLTAPSSSFGWWIAYLSKPGSKVYYRDILGNNETIIKELRPNDYFLPTWKVLKMKKNDGEILEN